ncbi:MAG: type II toxin-antitoxin system HicA family toxin [Sphingomonas sp.]|uniref:type II toxin-antitoxin system HicA family toxin n=1 Tax=Sphingomonas sp. TaxID=28214 RepID=UPI0025DE649F|nr:type II toxin-antitoxin system HicA family toxin [Sphingomonas sp.]MBY0284732.1 type II toxin-antitoxin system HicA family toxin [Sphingomonas sp.]
MPKLPVLSGAEVVRALERLGFEQIRQRGSHVVLQRGSAGCVVPLHKEVRKGTLATIIRQAGLSLDEFAGALA